MEQFVKVFRALAEPTRQRIVKLLALRPMYGCELEDVLQIGQSSVSQHIRTLKEALLVSEEKEGWWTRYTLNRQYLDELLIEWARFLDQPAQALPGWEPIAARMESWAENPPTGACRSGKRCRTTVDHKTSAQ